MIDNNPHCIEDLYAKYLQFTGIMLEEYKDIDIQEKLEIKMNNY